MTSTLRQPSAVWPIVMSAAALALVLGHAMVYGVDRNPDEGTAAHLYQGLIAGQVPIIAFFACKWLPRAPLEACKVLLLQGAAAALAIWSLLLIEPG